MEYPNPILELEEPARRINCGINALGVMAMGLSMAKDPYEDGFNAIWNYLLDANQELQKQISLCLNSIPAAE